MSDRVQLDLDGIQAVTAKASDVAATLRNAFTSLTKALDDNDGCWGDDDIGKHFEFSYQPATAREASGVNVETLEEWPTTVRERAANFAQLDEDNAAAMEAADHEIRQKLDDEKQASENEQAEQGKQQGGQGAPS